MEKRVVITGLGAITPVGIGKENFYNALLAGQSGIGPITRFDASDYATRIAGEVKDFDVTQYGVDKRSSSYGPFCSVCYWRSCVGSGRC